MKKNLLYLFTVLYMLSFFTACSDDEDVNVLEGVNTSFKGETLDLKYSGSPFLGKEVVFDTKDGQTATITMRGTLDMSALGGLLGGGSKSDLPTISYAPGVISGEVTTTLNNVVLTQVGETYMFEGTNEANGRTVKYTGEVKKDKMTLSLDVTMPTNPLQEGGLWEMAGSTFNWVSTTGITIPGLIDEPWPMKDASFLINMFFISPELKKVLSDVTFKADGNIVATYKNKAGVDVESPINLANYYIKNDKLYVTLNIDMIIQAATKAGNSEVLLGLMTELMQTPLMSALSEGFPLNYTIENGTVNISIDQDFLLPILKVLMNNEFLMGMLKDAMAGMGTSGGMAAILTPAIVDSIIEQIAPIVNGTSELSFGLELKK